MSTPSNTPTSATSRSADSMSENQSPDHDYPSHTQSPYCSPSHSSSNDNSDHPSTISFGVKLVIGPTPMDTLLCLQMLNIAAINPTTTSTRTASPLSPQGAGEILKCNDIDAITLHTIAKGLVTTIKNCETLHQAIVSILEDRIKSLEKRVGHYTDTFNRCPEDYEENVHYPGLSIPIGDSLCREVK